MTNPNPGHFGGRLWRRPAEPLRIAQLPPGVDVRFAGPAIAETPTEPRKVER